jgi:Domain of unknown function (DUF1963)
VRVCCHDKLGVMDDPGQLRSELHDLGAQHLDPQLTARVMSPAQPAMRLMHGSADAATLVHSRLGANPVPTQGTAWATWNGTPLSLLALISLAQLPPLDDTGLLPTAGYLNFLLRRRRTAGVGGRPGAPRRMPGDLCRARRRSRSDRPIIGDDVPGARDLGRAHTHASPAR